MNRDFWFAPTSEADRRCAWCGVPLPRGVDRIEVRSPLANRVYPICTACWNGPEAPSVHEALGLLMPTQAVAR